MTVLRCAHCQQLNRIPPETGTKGLVCGRCDADLPTPAILWRLHQVRNEIDWLLNNYHWYSPLRWKGIEDRLERQHHILANVAAAYPGFQRTCRACPDLVAEIDGKSRDLQAKLDGAALKAGIRILILIVRIIKVTFIGGPPALPPGAVA